jgi:uncharacterized lipoprotein NlpE involved in copper resistance
MLALSFFLTIFSAFPSAFAATTDMAEHHAQASDDWPGLYFGFTPCADCNGVKTTLALNKNKSYILITQYVGKSEREFVERGKFTWTDKSNTILLTPRNGSAPHQYFAGENILIQLDNNGNRFSGEHADRYILRRKDVTNAVSPHSSH